MATTTLDHQTLLEQDQKQLHPYYYGNNHDNPLIVERGDGVYLYTTDGRRILDGMAGLWNVNVGYSNQELIEAAFEQMKRLAYTSNFAGMTNPPSIMLAERLSGFAHPTLKTTFFVNGGSEANDTAFKLARYYWQRQGKKKKLKIISRKHAYHGITMAAMSATGIEKFQKIFGPLVPGFLHIPNPNAYRYEGDTKEGESVGQAAARALEEAILREGPETVAAFIAEPVQGAGGVIVPPDDYFARIREICDKYEVLFIADEVITGFGRTGKWFGMWHWDVQPDIMAFAKGITSGYQPLGGIQFTDEIREVIFSAPADEGWFHGFTYNGHATACVVALKNIEIIEREGLVEQAKQRGDRLLRGLESLTEFPTVANPRGIGLLAAIELVKDKDSREPDDDLAGQVMNACMERGLRTRTLGNSLALSPPLVISEDEVDQIIEILGGVLDTL